MLSKIFKTGRERHFIVSIVKAGTYKSGQERDNYRGQKNFTLNPCYLLGNQENKVKSMADRMEPNSAGTYRIRAKIFLVSIL